MAWLLKSSRRSLLANGGSFVGLALYLFLSAELSGWIAGHTVPRVPGAPAVEVPASISALRERYKYELLVSRYREEGQIDKAVFTHIFNLMYDLPTFQRPSASLLIGVQA